MQKRQLQFLVLFGGISALILFSLEGQLKGLSYTAGYFMYALNFVAITKIGSILVKRQGQTEPRQGKNLGITLLLFGKIAFLAGSLYLALVYFDLQKIFFAGGAMIAMLVSSVSVYLGFVGGQPDGKST